MTTTACVSDEDSQFQNSILEAQALLWNHTLGYIKSMCLKCAVELRIPDAIHRQGMPATISDLLSSLSIPKAKSRFLLIMMRLLSSQGIFKSHITLSEEEAFDLTPVSRLLISSASSHRLNSSPIVLMILDKHNVEPCQQLSRWFNNPDFDGNPFEMTHGTSFWDLAREQPEFNDLFNKGMESDSLLVMEFVTNDGRDSFRGIGTLVDVGGGTGSTAAALVKAFPEMKCTVLDLPTVINTAKKIDGIQFVSGDMFTEIPPADVALLKWILHDWSDEECIKIMRCCKEAIPPKEKGGKVIIIDMVVDKGIDNKISVETQLLIDMLMMIAHKGKERNEGEWHQLFTNAGFSSYKITSSIGLRSIIEVYP